MKKFISVILAAAAALALATGCNNTTIPSVTIPSVTVPSEVESLVSQGSELVSDLTFEVPTKDRAGNDIKVPEKVEKIASMAPSTTQILIELGLADKIVGIDTNSATYADKLAKDIPQFDMMNPDNEKIAALKPDIVFTSGMSSVGGFAPFQSLIDSGVCVADIPSPSTLEGICDDIEFIGNCVGKGPEALVLSKGFTAFVAAVEEVGKTIPADKQKTVLVMMNVPSADAPTIYTFGKGTYMDQMLTTIGAKNAFGDKEGWLSISVEDAIKANPDVILMDCDWMPGADEAVKKLAGWENVNAVKNGAVYQVKEDLCSRPNHHVSEAIIEWGKDVYPDQFGNFTKSFDDLKKEALEKIFG